MTQAYGNIPIVQGTAVPPPQQQQPYSYSAAPDYGSAEPLQATPFNGEKGEAQPPQFQDSIFAVAFVLHLIAVFVVLSMGASKVEGGDVSVSGGLAWTVAVCGLVAAGLSSLALGFMMSFATELVKIALIFSVGFSLALGIVGAMSGQLMLACMGFGGFALGCCYAYFVWNRIPFAAANLRTALTAVRANLGTAAIAYLFLFLAIGWSILWAVGIGGYTLGTGILFCFLVSYYWTHQVLKNTVHVSVVGVIGTWWYVPDEASSCCSSALMDSFKRACTYSFGSICFGSLLVALVQALRALREYTRNNDDCNFLSCIIDCILACIQGIIEYLNKWAYVYVGLYGYSYLEAGKNVIQLFQNKGWTTIITDDLADNVLFMMSVGIALATGLLGFIMGKMDGDLFSEIGYDDSATTGFIVGLFVGYLVGSIMMSVVGSAVNTVIVCFAEAPAEFEANHPILSQELRAAWRQAWPVECGRL